MSKVILWSRDHPLMVIPIVALISAFFASHAIHIEIDSSTEGMMIASDPAMSFYHKTLDIFGSDNITAVFVKDQDLFSYDKLTAIEDVFYNLQDIPGVTRVDGLFSATNFKGEDGMITTNPLLDWVPEDPSELAQIKADALRSPLLYRTGISPDGTSMAITVTVTPDPEEMNFNLRMADDIDAVIAPLKGKVDQVFQVGVPMSRRYMNHSTQRDQRTVGVLFLVVLLLVLIVGIRTVSGALLPLMTGGLSILWTMGFMALLDIPINFLTGVVPSLVLIIGATEDMHMLSEYLHGLEQGRDRMGAIEYMAGKTGLAVLLTGITTFFGFLSVAVNEITVLRLFGIVSAFALFVNPFITLTLVPIYLRFFGEKKARTRGAGPDEQKQNGFLNYVTNGIIHLLDHHHRSIRIVFLFVIPLMGAGFFS